MFVMERVVQPTGTAMVVMRDVASCEGSEEPVDRIVVITVDHTCTHIFYLHTSKSSSGIMQTEVEIGEPGERVQLESQQLGFSTMIEDEDRRRGQSTPPPGRTF